MPQNAPSYDYLYERFFSREGTHMKYYHHEDTTQGGFVGLLYDRFAATIFTYLSQQVPNEQDAEDLLLEVFLAALSNQSLSSFPVGEQLAWLRRVAHNKVVDRYRHVALLTLLPIEEAMEMVDNAFTPEQYAERHEKFTHLYQAIASLPTLQRELLRLRYRNELRFHEIAMLLEKPEGTVRKMLVRTLCQLREIFNTLEGEMNDATVR